MYIVFMRYAIVLKNEIHVCCKESIYVESRYVKSEIHHFISFSIVNNIIILYIIYLISYHLSYRIIYMYNSIHCFIALLIFLYS